ncbi:MAG: peptidoglycan editing factor PgeF [Colwellia sp.]
MPKTHTNKSQSVHFTNATFELVKWPVNPSHSVDGHVIAIQTTRLVPQKSAQLQSSDNKLEDEKTPFYHFNLGLHVGDNAEQVTKNRDMLTQFIRQQLSPQSSQQHNQYLPAAQNTSNIKENPDVKIQWLQQVHGNEVVTVSIVDERPLIADASITRQKNIALAIMTADCLPILLTHKKGIEVAAIHGGWRSLAANIITKTIAQMQSPPTELIAWLGPCIGKNAFEVGNEVKQNFVQQDTAFEKAFLLQENGKYLADLHKIARLQLQIIGITETANLAECTYQQTDKYYSYRKEKITGRMASIICRR